MRWWAKYLEKFGMPTVAGRYDAKAGYGVKQQREFLSLLAAVHNESALVHPSDMEVKLLEAQRVARDGVCRGGRLPGPDHRQEPAGPVLDLGQQRPGRTYALGAVQANVLSFYLQKLQRDLEDVVMNEQVIKRLVGYNFPPGTPMPTFHLGRMDDDRLAATAALMQTLITGQVVAPDEPWIRGFLGLPAASGGGEDGPALPCRASKGKCPPSRAGRWLPGSSVPFRGDFGVCVGDLRGRVSTVRGLMEDV